MTAQAGDTPHPPDREALRRAGRHARMHLSARYRAYAAHRAAIHARLLAHRLQARSIGAYIAYGSELDTQPLLTMLCAQPRTTLCLPRVTRDGQMVFQQWSGGPLRTGAFGIPSPVSGPRCFAGVLDLLLLPLVAFDRAGSRLGAGAGYYDRYLAKAPRHRPFICGYAFAAQEVDAIERAPWDIPLQGIVTERGFRRLSR